MKKLMLILVLLAGVFAAQAQDKGMAQTVAAYNKKCPIVMDEGLTLKSVELADNNFVFVYTVDDDMFNSLDGIKDILKDSFVAELVTTSEPLKKEMVAQCRALGVNVVQRFVNSAGKTFDIVILTKELQ